MSAVVDPRLSTANTPVASAGVALPVSRVDFGEFSRDLLHGIRWLHDIHGPIGAIEDGGQRVIFLFSPEYNQQVLSDTELFHAHFFAIRGPKNSAQRRVTCGLLSMNGDQHRRNRRIVKEPFGLRSINTYADTILRLTDEMLATWRSGEQRDMAEEDFFFPTDLTDKRVEPRAYTFRRPWGVPVRYHDLAEYANRISPDLFEFHLSYADMDLDIDKYLDRTGTKPVWKR